MSTAFFVGSVEHGVRAVPTPEIKGPGADPKGHAMSLTIDPNHVRSMSQLSAMLTDLRALLADSLRVRRVLGGFPLDLANYPASVQAELAAQLAAAKQARGNQ